MIMQNVISSFTWADYAILIIIGSSVITSLMRGFVREGLSLVTWAVGFWVAFNFNHQLATLLTQYINTPSLRHIASFSILLIVTLVIGSMFSSLLSSIITSTGLSGADRSLGMFFGFARGVLLVGILLLLISLTSFQQDSWWRNSALIGHFQPVTMWLRNFLPDTIKQLSSFIPTTNLVPNSLEIKY